MAVFAVLDNDNLVTNVIVCESLELAEKLTGCTCIENTDENSGAIGDIYDETNNVFTKPTPTSEG